MIGVIKSETNSSPDKASSEMTTINIQTNIANMTSSSSSSVDEILEKLVNHYSQSVHQKVNNDDNEQQQQQQQYPPYFDPLIGNNTLKVPSMIQYFLETLMAEVEEGPMLLQPTKIFDGINGYVKYIRPTIVPTSNNSKSSTTTFCCCCVPVLEHYEILISQWMKRILLQQQQQKQQPSPPPPPNSTSSSTSTTTTLVHTTPKIIDDDFQKRQQQQLQNIFYTIEVISSDITILSSSSVIKKDSLSSYSRCNIVIPCLLRILSHIFNLMDYFDIRLFDNNNENNSLDDDNDGDDERNKQRTTKSIIRCIVSLLSFDTPTILDPRNVAKSSLLNFHIGYMDRFCACPPPLVVLMNSIKTTTETRDAKTGEKGGGSYSIVDNFFSIEQTKYIDWKSVCIEDTTWMDNVSGVTSRAAYDVWIALRSLLVVIGDQNDDEYHDDDDTRTEKGQIPYFQHTIKDKEITIRSILKLFDTIQLAKAVREHFFGLDLKLWEKETRISEHVIMGRRVTRTELVIKDKPFQVIPSRVNAAMNFLRRLGRCNQEQDDDNDDDDLSWPSSRKRDLLVELMPIIFELLDASNAAHIALGVSSLIHLLDVIQPTKESIEGFAEPVMSALDLDFTSRREEPLLFLIGQAQIRLVPHLDDPNKRRRKLTKRWLSLLSQSTGRLNTINLCFVVLIGGVIPLLYQHTQQPNADAMELSRLGLSAILPLLDNEFYHNDSNIHSAALLALLNLMIGGYPAMPDHGGKIICSILALALSSSSSSSSQESSSSDNDNDKKYSPNPIRKLCIHTGAVALNLCGDKYAGKLLDELETKHDTYQQELFTVIADVKNNAKTLSDE